MKFIIAKILLLVVLIIGIQSRNTRSKITAKSKSKTELKTHMKTTYWVRPLIKTSSFYHSFANLAYCPGDVINQLGCPLCDQILDASFEVFKFHKEKIHGYNFTYVILLSVNRNEAVVALSGPANPNPAFYSTIYSRGFTKYGKGVKIETTYLDAYNGNFKKSLQKDISLYLSKFKVNQNDHKFVFVGHNFGGSIATLAAYDLVKSKIIKKNPAVNSPIVYSYGALRIGNSKFVNKVNKLFKVVRIVKEGDFYPRMPSCSWSPSIKKFRCQDRWTHDRIKESNRPPLYNYIQNYYGQRGGLVSGIDAAYGSFIEKSSEKRQVGWSYAANDPGYTVNSLGQPFNELGKGSDEGAVTYSQPLGAEVLFTNNFRKHTVCSYFYGIPNCEQEINSEYGKDVGNSYYNADLTKC